MDSQPERSSLNQLIRPDYLVATSPDSSIFVSTGDLGHIRFWNGSDQLQQIAPFSMGKPYKIMLGKNGYVILLNTEGKFYAWKTDINSYDSVQRRAFQAWTASNKASIERYPDRTVVRDNTSDEVLFSFSNGPETVPFLSVAPDGKTVAHVYGKTLDVYDAATRSKSFSYDFESEIDVCCIKFSSNGKAIAVVRSNIVYTSRYESGNLQKTEQSHSIDIITPSAAKEPVKIFLPKHLDSQFYLQDSQFSPKGTFLVVPSKNGVYLFDSSSGALRHSIPYESQTCNLPVQCSSFAIGQDEKFVGITNLSKQTVELWSIYSYRYLSEVIKTGIETPEMVHGAAFVNSGQIFVWTSGSSGRLHFYDIRTRSILADFPTGELILFLESTPDGNLLINKRHLLKSEYLATLLAGDPISLNGAISRNSLKLRGKVPRLLSQGAISAVLPNREPLKMIAVAENGSEEAGYDEFGGVEPIKPKAASGGKPGRCHAAFTFPLFNAYPINFLDQNAPICADYPLIDVTKGPKPRWATTSAEFDSVREFHAGDSIAVGIYVNNGAADSNGSESTAKDVAIETKLRNGGNNHYITATVTASNAAPLTHTITIKTDEDEFLEIVPNSGYMYDYQGRAILDQQKLNLGNSTFLVGDLDADWKYSLFFTYLLVVKKK